jgi:hypothetical protein
MCHGYCGVLPICCGALPICCGALPICCGALPICCGALPICCGVLPICCGALPQTLGTLPQTLGTLPQTLGMSPQTLGTLPQTLGMLPQTLGMLPQTLGTSPQVLGSSPQALGTSPQALGTSPQALGTSSQVLGTSPAMLRHTMPTAWIEPMHAFRNDGMTTSAEPPPTSLSGGPGGDALRGLFAGRVAPAPPIRGTLAGSPKTPAAKRAFPARSAVVHALGVYVCFLTIATQLFVLYSTPTADTSLWRRRHDHER